MRIDQVIADISDKTGGTSHSVVRLCDELSGQGLTVNLHTLEPAPGGPSVAALRIHPRRSGARGLGLSPHMQEVFRTELPQSDVVHVHGLWTLPGAYAASAFAPNRSVLFLSPRGMLNPSALNWKRWRKKVFWGLSQKRTIDRATCLHATSMEELEAVRALGLRMPVAVVPNGVDIPALDTDRQRSSDKVLLYLGRLHPIKNLEVLLRSWSALADHHRRWNLRIVGQGESAYVNRLKESVSNLGLERVTFVDGAFGARRTREYLNADVFVQPSLGENFGSTIAEALSAAVPVIASRGTPWADLEAHRCGWWIDADDTSFTLALHSALSLPGPTLREMGDRGRTWMAASFGWHQVARDHLAAYRWALNGEPKPPFVYTVNEPT